MNWKELEEQLIRDEIADKRSLAIKKEVEFLMSKGQEFDPFSTENFAEAWREMPDDELQTINASLTCIDLNSRCALAHSLTVSGGVIASVRRYWEGAATLQAEKNVDRRGE